MHQTGHASGLHTLAHIPPEVPPEAIQYAPPLSAYSAEHCGLSVAYTEYNRALQMMAFTGTKDVPVLSPQVLKRLDILHRIRATGYDSLAPVGINRTMREMDEEAQLEEEDEDAPGVQAENLTAAGTTHAGDILVLIPQNSPNLTSQVLPELPVNVFPEADLDAHVPDADASELSVGESLSRSDSDTPDAFMAEDVEYQYDHSLFHDSGAGHGSISDSHASFSTGSVLSGANMASIPTTSTLATPTSNLRVCDDSDVDMTLE